ncbi:MAG: PIN domain-containing protein [bacterium]
MSRKKLKNTNETLALGEAYANSYIKKDEEKLRAFLCLMDLLRGRISIISNDYAEEEFEKAKEKFPRLSISDALHIATAIKHSCSIFKTADRDIYGLNPCKIYVLALMTRINLTRSKSPAGFFFIILCSIILIDMTLSQLKSIKDKKSLKRAILEYGKNAKKQKKPLDIRSFGFVQREKKNNKIVKNRCLRDFLYYVLHYYFPEVFNPDFINPQTIEDIRLFGFKIPEYLPAGGAQYSGIPKLLRAYKLKLELNGKKIQNKKDFLKYFIFKSISYDNLIKLIKHYLKNDIACGIDIPVKLLLDHIIFICGIDSENLYLIDTHIAKKVNYKKISKDKNKFVMAYKSSDLEKDWGFRGLLWAVV